MMRPLTHTLHLDHWHRAWTAELMGFAALVCAVAGVPMGHFYVFPIGAILLGTLAIEVIPDASPDVAPDRESRRDEFVSVSAGLIAILTGVFELIFQMSR